MMPLYGFLQGDTLGILVFAQESDTIAELAAKLRSAADVRVGPDDRQPRVVHHGEVLNPKITVDRSGLEALDRFDVVWEAPHGL